ncbi:TN [Mytilus edulis]|uniref:TN n=1 Tax=Mytilus edulis TaxID=6550 RepID=A0A8S3PP76_MYTED|nr:TN [Mytilus edulis]
MSPTIVRSMRLLIKFESANRWNDLTLSTKKVMDVPNKHCRYELQDLSPETWYEIKYGLLTTIFAVNIRSVKETDIKVAPKEFEINECTERSITIEWSIDESDNCPQYEIAYQVQSANRWNDLTLSTKKVMDVPNKHCRYELQDLSPETWYEIKIRAVDNHLCSQYTECKRKQTLKVAPKEFEINECTERSITIEWNIDEFDNCPQYEIAYQVQSADRWNDLTLSTEKVMDVPNKHCRYELQDLSPETWYEIKIRAVDNHLCSQYTESPKEFEINECTERSITIEWSIDESDNCPQYEIAYQVQSADRWNDLTLSTEKVMDVPNKHCRYELQDLSPETWYGIKIRAVDNNLPSQYTESPKEFEINECTERSITIGWSIDESDNCPQYEIAYQVQSADRWNDLTLSTEKVMDVPNKHCRYELQDLSPETWYGIKIRAVDNNLPSQYTECKNKQTLKVAPKEFDIFECTERSITIGWSIDESENCPQYEIAYQVQSADRWNELTLSTEKVMNVPNKRCMYELQDLSPETWYEIKIRAVDNNLHSQYTECKNKQTLKVAPKEFEIIECTERSITIGWSIDESDNCPQYEIAYQVQSADSWIELTLSTEKVMDVPNKRCRYELQALSPETWYEIKIRAVDNHLRSQYTESPKEFDIIECTERSITFGWSIDESDNCPQYGIAYQVQSANSWNDLTLSTEKVMDVPNKRCRYELQDLSPETWYEIKIRAVDNHLPSQYTECKKKQTLKVGKGNHILVFTYCC